MQLLQTSALVALGLAQASVLDDLSPSTRAQLKRVDRVYPFFSVNHLNQVANSVGAYLGLVEPEPESTLYITNLMQANEIVQVLFNVNEDLDGDAVEAFLSAAEFWNRVVGETNLQQVSTGGTNPAAFCGLNANDFAGAPTEFSTIVIAAQTVAIDGRGGTLAQAGPCASDNNNIPRIGIMSFDVADADNLLAQGQFETVVAHEMGHVIGIGTGWGSRGLVNNPCTQFNPCNTNPRYVGQNGLEGFQELGGTGNLDVADQGGAGTANAHWREDTFENELMTGFLSSGNNPLSIMTVKSLLDVGFVVDEDEAEFFQIPGVELPDDAPQETENNPSSAPTYMIDMGDDTWDNEGTNQDNNALQFIGGDDTNTTLIAIAGVAAVIAVVAGVAILRGRKQANVRKSERWITNAK